MQEPMKVTAATVEVTLEDGSKTKFDIEEIREGSLTFDNHTQVDHYVSDPAMIGMSGPRHEFDRISSVDPEMHLDITDMRGVTLTRMPPPGVSYFPKGMV